MKKKNKQSGSRKLKKTSLTKLVKKVSRRLKVVRRRSFKELLPQLASAVFSAPQPSPRPAHSEELPANYGDTRLVLLVRDPWWLYAYWEIVDSRVKHVHGEVQRRGLQIDKTVLRVYDVTGKDIDSANSFFDVELLFFTNNWYLDVAKPGTEWQAELGVRAADGQFFSYVRSNRIRTPRFGVSDVIDEEWMLPDDLYWRLLGVSCGHLDCKSSLDVRERLLTRLQDNPSSR